MYPLFSRLIFSMAGLGLVLGAITVASVSAPAQFESFDNDGPVLIWVTIRAHRDEGPWQACRRVYQRDVYQVSDRTGNRVRCRIDHSRIYQPGEVRQNFNRQ